MNPFASESLNGFNCKSRREISAKLCAEQWDLLIIGGGITRARRSSRRRVARNARRVAGGQRLRVRDRAAAVRS